MISKIIFSVAAVMVLTSAAALASIDICSVDPETNSVVIEGSTEPNEQVLLTVIKKGASEDDFFDNIYSSHRIKRVEATRMINCNSEARGKIKELLISNF